PWRREAGSALSAEPPSLRSTSFTKFVHSVVGFREAGGLPASTRFASSRERAGGSRAMRARKPDREGYTVRDGVRLHWELYGQGDPTVFLLPTWSIIHSRHWKFQIAHLARHCRVLVMDG